jgi:hypothetical protein
MQIQLMKKTDMDKNMLIKRMERENALIKTENTILRRKFQKNGKLSNGRVM